MGKIRRLIPMKLLIAAAVVFGLSFATRPLIAAIIPPEQASSDVLVIAIPFLFIFVPIILCYMSVIVFIAGIGLGIFGMFQPWVFALFKIGFLVLLASVLGFIMWSHVVMKRTRRHGSHAAAEAQAAAEGGK
jgi:hypothetical protein